MKILTTIFFVINCLSAFSQFSDSVNYYVNFAGTGNINKADGPTAYIFNNGVRFSVSKKHFSLNSANSWIYGQNGGKKTNNDFLSVLDADLFKSTRKIYYWGLASYENSFSLKIDGRFQIGSGIGYHLLKTPKSSIVLSDGILFETTSLAEKDQYDRLNYSTFRNSFRLKFRFVIKDIFVVDGVDFIQHSLSDKLDYIVRSNTNLSVRLNKWLGLTVAFTYNRLNLTGRENLLLNYGLTMEKYF